MTRILRSALLAAVLLTAGIAASAHGASWTPVSGLLPSGSTTAALDGPRILVGATTGDVKRVVLTTVARNAVARRQTLPGGGRVRSLQVASLPGGRALAVWQGGNTVLASLRPSADAPFGDPRTVSVFAGAVTGAARIPALVVTTTGEAVVVWWGGIEGRTPSRWASSMAADGTWGEPVDIPRGACMDGGSVGTGPQVRDFAVAADPQGGLAIAWIGEQLPPFGIRVAGAVRSPAWVWGPATSLGFGDFSMSAPAVAAPAPGVLVAAWVSEGCTTSAVLRGGTLEDGTLFCTGYAPLAASVPGGGAMVAAQRAGARFGPGFGIVASLDPAGAGSPAQTAVSGMTTLSGLVPTTGGRTALLTIRDYYAARVALIRPDGTVQRRISSPEGPQPPLGGIRLLPLGPGATVALLLTSASRASGAPMRARILTIGPG